MFYDCIIHDNIYSVIITKSVNYVNCRAQKLQIIFTIKLVIRSFFFKTYWLYISDFLILSISIYLLVLSDCTELNSTRKWSTM